MFNHFSILLLPLLASIPTQATTITTTNNNNSHLNFTLPHPLLPWQVTHLSTFSPSGYPANHPYSRLTVTIADPNTITLGPTRFGDAAFPPTNTTCVVWWLAWSEDPREGPWVNTCGEIRSGKWTVEMLPPPATGEEKGSPTTDFVLRFTLSEAVVLGRGGVARLTFEGQAAFAVGPNMSGACGGSGVCSWSLKEGVAPVLVNQTLVEVKCVTEECVI